MRMKAKTLARKTPRRPDATTRRRTVAANPKATRHRTAVAKAAPSAAAKKAPARKPREPRKRAARQTKLKIPVILLQGDHPAPPPVSGPGERYALGPTPPEETSVSAEGKLPEAYGTKRLFLAARDPHWLYAHWDLTREQQRHYNARSADGHLVLRVYVNRLEDAPLAEIHVHPESRHWFIHVGRGGTKYVAELGYPSGGGVWTRVAASEATLTPEDMPAEEALVEFATIPADLPLPQLVALVQRAAFTHLPLALALEELRQAGHPELPRIAGRPLSTWTPEQERALAEVINLDAVRRVWVGPLEITELVRRQHLQQLASPAGAAFGQPTSPVSAVTSVSSLFGGEQAGAKGFWFNVNAELIIYGATEPGASVTIGGRPVRLRPDGSFSCRFALPDGGYELPAVAVSADQTDARAAELEFSRRTMCWGDVGAHPQDPALKPPAPENV
jgi:hypothetical protein